MVSGPPWEADGRGKRGDVGEVRLAVRNWH